MAIKKLKLVSSLRHGDGQEIKAGEVVTPAKLRECGMSDDEIMEAFNAGAFVEYTGEEQDVPHTVSTIFDFESDALLSGSPSEQREKAGLIESTSDKDKEPEDTKPSLSPGKPMDRAERLNRPSK